MSCGCRLQTRLGSRVAVALAQAGGCSSDWTPSLRASICHRSSPEKAKRQKKNVYWGFTVAQQGKNPVLSLLWLRFHPWLGNFHTVPWPWPKRKKKKEFIIGSPILGHHHHLGLGLEGQDKLLNVLFYNKNSDSLHLRTRRNFQRRSHSFLVLNIRLFPGILTRLNFLDRLREFLQWLIRVNKHD